MVTPTLDRSREMGISTKNVPWHYFLSSILSTASRLNFQTVQNSTTLKNYTA